MSTRLRFRNDGLLRSVAFAEHSATANQRLTSAAPVRPLPAWYDS